MNVHPPSRQDIVRYLFGELADEEALEKIEDQFFDDDSCHAFVVEVEEDLIRQYLRGELTGSDRERFERGYLRLPARRARLEVARALHNRGRRRKLWLILPPAIAAAIALVFAVRHYRDVGPTGQQVLLTFTLSPGYMGPGERPPSHGNLVEIPRLPADIEIVLPVGKEALPRYQVHLQRASDKASTDLGSVQAMRAATGEFELRVRTRTSWLREGDYLLLLTSPSDTGTIDAGGFSFRVRYREP